MEELRTKTEYQPANDPLGFPQAIAQKIVNRFSADYFNLHSQVQTLPDAIRRVDRSFALDGESKAGPVAQREAEGASDPLQFGGDAGLFIAEEANSAFQTPDPTPGLLRLRAAIDHAAVNLGEIDRAHKSALNERRHDFAAWLAKEEG
jgi:hypothetical protein